MRRPRVSVVVPTFQSATRIGATLARLRAQTCPDFEVIVVNDGSTDETSAAVHCAMATDSRIRLVEQSNGGIAAARNRGVEEAWSDVLAFLDDDDLWHPRKLELQLARLGRMSDTAVVSCYSALVDAEGRLLGWRIGGTPEGNVYREMLEWDMVSGGSVALVARGAFEASGGFDATLPDRADWDLWIRLARRYSFTCVPRTLVGYTRRAGSVSQRYDRMLACGREVLAKARRDDPRIGENDHEAFLARDLFGAACFCLADQRHGMALSYLAHALRSSPRMILGRPRRWGIIAMTGLAVTLPGWLYRQAALATMSRAAFRLRVGAKFDSLE